MSHAPLASPTLVRDADELDRITNILSSTPRIAVDTESNSLFAYQERVCLLQFSTPDEDYLIDPLAISNLEPLASIFSDPAIEKVFHGAEYDIICLSRDFNFSCENLFDTRVAARTLGWKRSGLGHLLSTIFCIEVDKRYQRSNWGKRPLTDEMLDYARLDTHYLIPLREHLANELLNASRWNEAHELCQSMAALSPTTNGFEPDGFWRIRNARELSPRQLGVLREVYVFRDQHARKLDRPPFKVMGDQSLIAIAKACPKDETELNTLPGMSAGQVGRYGDGLIAAVKRGLSTPPPKMEANKRMAEDTHQRYEALRIWRRNLAHSRQVESDIILPKDVMREIAMQAPSDPESLRQIMMPLEWRFQKYGEQILDTISEKAGT
jgi:ribonuclease D